MRIESVTPIFVDRYLFVEIRTDTGLVGLGESGAWGFQEGTAATVERFAEYLVGQDPLKIEHHWQYLYRWTHFRGSVVMGAVSAIDIALWDIAGKHFETPVHQLLGGKVRDRARVYYHVFGETTDELCEGIAAARGEGYTAVGHLTPFVDAPRDESYFETHVRKIENAAASVARYREVAGTDVDLCIEIHRRLAPYEAVQLGLAIQEYTPLFLEDPVLPDNIDEMAYVASKINIPIATGERYTSHWEFQMLLARGGAQMVRPDVCLVGGITGARKIAAIAEASHVGVVPHNPLSPVSTAACLQIAATAPNFVLQEFPNETWGSAGDMRPDPAKLVTGAALHDGEGFVHISDEPGIGVALQADAEQRYPYRKRQILTRLHVDGSVVDQ
ncbi:mandelate racemase/muconate lactonizing enzyme family protein [Actinopolymorpha pittospori]|uniref:Galactonate dehydratase n=1 Tax=Actinopolymorpha pittospori TaxID=648752 RepID=A0A927N754_9ACTN|nr:mandelate racemase/muconate lactonizing enzyme family protein [Actinopolymorpha pittospori]MBE1612233.1 galactonate dehydratase [Actinopolymorpha pittospori]